MTAIHLRRSVTWNPHPGRHLFIAWRMENVASIGHVAEAAGGLSPAKIINYLKRRCRLWTRDDIVRPACSLCCQRMLLQLLNVLIFTTAQARVIGRHGMVAVRRSISASRISSALIVNRIHHG